MSSQTRTFSQKVPPSREGDRTGRAEFERRREATPDLRRAGPIDGVVHVPSPVSMFGHGFEHGRLMTRHGVNVRATPGVVLGDMARAGA